VSAKSGSQERSEDDLGAAEGRKRQPQEEDELEDKVEGEPVNDADEALEHGEEGKYDPVGEPLGIIGGSTRKQGVERVVAGDDESSQVGKELAAKVENDEEEVESTRANKSIRLGHAGLPFEVGDGGVLGELSIERTKDALGFFLSGRHFGDESLADCAQRGWRARKLRRGFGEG
jgi:hypothetical protein